MNVDGTITDIETYDQETRRGWVTITRVWLEDHHDRPGEPKSPPTLWALDYANTRSHDWAELIADAFRPGDRVLADVDEHLATGRAADQPSRAYIATRGIDLTHSNKRS